MPTDPQLYVMGVALVVMVKSGWYTARGTIQSVRWSILAAFSCVAVIVTELLQAEVSTLSVVLWSFAAVMSALTAHLESQILELKAYSNRFEEWRKKFDSDSK